MQKIKLYDFLPTFSLLLIFIIDLFFIVSIHWQWNHSMNKYLPLQIHIQTLKSDVSKSHLWLEEAITGDTSIDIERDILTPLKHESFTTYMMDVETIFSKQEDAFYVTKLKSISQKLDVFYAIAKQRLGEIKKHHIGSELDQYFDTEFRSILHDIDSVSSAIDAKLSKELSDKEQYFKWIIGLFILINIIVFSMLFVSRVRQDRYRTSLLEEKERAVVTLASIGDAVITTDMEGNITYINEVAENLTEYNNDEVQGLPVDSVLNLYNMKSDLKISSPIKDVIHNGMRKLISNGTKLISRSGKEYILSDSAAPVINKEGEILGTVLVFQNDTDRHALEEVIRRSEAKYRSLVENVKQHYFFYAHDLDGLFTYVSKSVTEILGYAVEDIKHHYSIYLSDDPINDKVDEFTKKCMEGKRQNPYIISMKHKNDSIVYLEVVESPVFDKETGVVTSIEGVARDITENYLAQKSIKKQKELLEYRAHHDALTNLPNRQLFLDRLAQSMRYAKRFNEKVAVLFIDLDHFKEINDSLGHLLGDEVLKVVSQKLEEGIRTTDTLARLGGDEFIIILDTLPDTSMIIRTIQKLMHKMKEPIVINEHQLYVTLSIGISIYPDDGIVSEDLLKNADAAMYDAKNNGRNTYCFYTQTMTQRALERVEMETSLRQALEREEFVMYYHTQVDGLNDEIVGIEALVRWNHPEKGIVSPLKFIPLSEEIGLIVPLGKWIIKTVMLQVVKWKDQGLNPGKVAINLSINQLDEQDFIPNVAALLDQTGCKPSWISFEVTETQIMKNPEESILVLQQLHEMGIELAVDDFGTGYSSLSYLKRLPINKLKIDKSFVNGLPHNKEDVGIAKALIILASSLDLDIIAEGVETLEQKNFLVENGCKNIQGFFYAKPVPSQEVLKR